MLNLRWHCAKFENRWSCTHVALANLSCDGIVPNLRMVVVHVAQADLSCGGIVPYLKIVVVHVAQAGLSCGGIKPYLKMRCARCTSRPKLRWRVAIFEILLCTLHKQKPKLPLAVTVWKKTKARSASTCFPQGGGRGEQCSQPAWLFNLLHFSYPGGLILSKWPKLVGNASELHLFMKLLTRFTHLCICLFVCINTNILFCISAILVTLQFSTASDSQLLN